MVVNCVHTVNVKTSTTVLFFYHIQAVIGLACVSIAFGDITVLFIILTAMDRCLSKLTSSFLFMMLFFSVVSDKRVTLNFP